MATTPHIPLRDARDRLLDLLGIGYTYPLRDLTVSDEQLTVAFNTSAKIPIDDSQPGVLYQLHHNQQPVERSADDALDPGTRIEAEGNGGSIRLETFRIAEDITFQIYARKPASNGAKNVRETYLHQTATIKVGLDTKLLAWVQAAPLLEPGVEKPALAAPRLASYAAQVDVEIQNSQEGVDYRLVYLRPAADGQQEEEVELSVKDERGNLRNLVLRTKPVEEDIDIRIRATKTFDPSEHRKSQTALLDVVLPLKVRANPALPVTVTPEPIIDFNTPATIKVGNTQRSAQYQLFVAKIADHDFVRQPEADVITVAVAGEDAVQVRKPVAGEAWAPLDGFTALDDAPQVGTGGELLFTLPQLTDDCLVIIQARKDHVAQAAQGEQPARLVSSALQLAQAAVVLVRPNPAPALRIQVRVEGGTTSGELLVLDGQPGVFYYLRNSAAGDDLALPAYFHKRDDSDERLNKGLDQLAVEVDFVVVRPLSPASANSNLAELPPLPPLLETAPLATGMTLHILAVKAQTRVSTPLSHTPEIPAGPEILPENSIVDYGAKTKIRIKASQGQELYQLFQDGEPLADPVKGTGKDRLLDTGELRHDTTFELRVTQPDAPIVVERLFSVVVMVRPDASLVVNASEALVDANTAATITVATSQPGVSYQLVVGETVVGNPVEGNGATISLTSGPLTGETTFAVRATKVGNVEIFALLAQQVSVQVRPAPTPEPNA